MVWRIPALVLKDLYLCRREICGCWIGFVVFALILMRIAEPRDTGHRFLILGPGNLFLNLLYTEFLIFREKTKGTLAWLRAMPLSDSHLAASKFLALVIVQAVGYLATTAIIAPQWLAAGSGLAFYCYGLLILCFGSLMLVTRWFCGQRLGQVIPLAVFSLAWFAFFKLRQTHPWLDEWLADSWRTYWFQGLLTLAAVAWVASLWWIALVFIGSRDTSRLID